MERWQATHAHARRPPAADWVELHPLGIYEFKGFLAPSEADAIVQTLHQSSSGAWESYDTPQYFNSINDCFFQNFSNTYSFDESIEQITGALQLRERIRAATGMDPMHYWKP